MSGKLVSVRLRNFQAHGDRKIEFGPTVNVIVGPNSAGKSTILRAIRWVVFNRPLGDRVVSWGKDHCEVKLITELCEVTRTRGSENTYQIDDQEPFKAVGSDVPKDVTEALRLDLINFQKQIDGPFWLALSAPEIAREMNKVVDLSVIDRSMSNVGGSLRDAQAQVKALTGLLSEARIKVGRLRWVQEVEKEAREALECEQEATRKRSEAQTIARLIEEIEEAQSQSYAIPNTSEALPLISRLNEIKSEVGSLSKMIRELETLEREQCELQEEMRIVQKKAAEAKPVLCPTCGRVIQNELG